MANVIIKEVEEFDIILSEKIDFDINKKDEYLELFENKKSEGVFKCEFQDDVWIMVFGGEERKIPFPNEMEFRKLANIFGREVKEFILAYKSFIMINSNHTSMRMFNSRVKSFANDINTEFDRRIGTYLYDFIMFIKIPYDNQELFEKVIDIVEKGQEKEAIQKRNKQARVLPKFMDVFKFSDIVNDIVENKRLVDYKRYLMTIVWWKVCSIIPLRPSEFVRTPFDCVERVEGQYIMHLKRNKTKGRETDLVSRSCLEEDVYYDDTIVIDEEMYSFIRNIQEILKNEFGYQDDERLLPICLKTQTVKKKSGLIRQEINKEQTTYTDLKYNLGVFYEEIVYKEYGFIPVEKYIKKDVDKGYIEKATLNDARHIAIINLILLGVDILEVMYLAGHSLINTTYGYYNHVKEITDSYAIAYKNRKQSKDIITDNSCMVIERINNRNLQALQEVKDELFGYSRNYPKVRGGYCSYTNIRNDKSPCQLVERNHADCPYFIAKNKEVIENRINELNDGIETEVCLLKDMIQDMHKIGKFKELYQSSSHRLERNIAKKILLTTKM